MDFIKMHGLGNDFIIIRENIVPENTYTLAPLLCDRHQGIGADGLVVITPSDVADGKMTIINADGNEAEQCGNAIRCVGKLLGDETQKETLQIETSNKVQEVTISSDGNVCVDMGKPIFDASLIPVNLEGTVMEYPINIDHKAFRMSCVSMGNPHAVIEVADATTFPVEAFGPKIEHHVLFPNKINVEFMSIVSKNEVQMRVWERGVGLTKACGSGACAAFVIGVVIGKLDRSGKVHLEMGDLRIRWDERDEHVYMTGPVTHVYKGTY